MKNAIGALFALALSALTVDASTCQPIRVACPNDLAPPRVKILTFDSSGVEVGGNWTDSLGLLTECGLAIGGTYTFCVDESTLPAGALIRRPCQTVTTSLAAPVLEFVLEGDFCDETPPQGECWMTGGGTIDRSRRVPNYSFGGVVYPGCSPKAAEGGNWNVVDHNTGLHFQGQDIIVDSCSGVNTRSPRVNVNIIDFHGTGIIAGIGGNPEAKIPVTFEGRVIDNLEPGGGADKLYIKVNNGAIVMLQIGNSAADPATTSTGNLQIHTSSCNN